jgi:hypothetical protein
LLTSRGDINTYAVFSELDRQLLNGTGYAGIIIPTGIATDATTASFFADLVNKSSLVRLLGYHNERFLFPAVDHRVTFCQIILTGAKNTVKEMIFSWFAFTVNEANDINRQFSLTKDDFFSINPNTLTCPIFRTDADASLTKKIYQKVPVLENEATGENPWGISFMRMFDMSNDSGLFRNEPGEGLLPLYEAKMFHQFDHRFSTYEGATESQLNVGILPRLTDEEKQNPNHTVTPRYWVDRVEVENRLDGKWSKEYLLVIRSLTRTTDERTTITSIIPEIGVAHSSSLCLTSRTKATEISLLTMNFNSLVFDFAARQKLGGTNFSGFILKQLPVIPSDHYSSADIDFIAFRVLELVYTAWDMQPFAQDMGYEGEPFIWNSERRAFLRAELDAYYAHLYGLTRDEIRYILDPADVYGPDFPSETFRVLKNNEIKQFGEYRTQRLVLEAWDKMFG